MTIIVVIMDIKVLLVLFLVIELHARIGETIAGEISCRMVEGGDKNELKRFKLKAYLKDKVLFKFEKLPCNKIDRQSFSR